MLIGIGRSQLAVDLSVEADDAAFPGIGDEPHFAGLPRLEAGRRPGRDVQPEAARLFAIEGECGVGLVEMIMLADLDWSIAGIGNRQDDCRSDGVYLALARTKFITTSPGSVKSASGIIAPSLGRTSSHPAAFP
jgi:hypothetical protein